ncbi:hypothetical protein [Paracoccus sp. IB05]|uniref:hypothetical protein n=1 Tax=Paracoccus sp. IB05 TaxID=2779367 RepID=UPI0018E84E57|nr:hypothetical protein [Paracoccus sp. IB05]MBJ2152368.1 hypothetical protein [Paracoccus sp. IB05]
MIDRCAPHSGYDIAADGLTAVGQAIGGRIGRNPGESDPVVTTRKSGVMIFHQVSAAASEMGLGAMTVLGLYDAAGLIENNVKYPQEDNWRSENRQPPLPLKRRGGSGIWGGASICVI